MHLVILYIVLAKDEVAKSQTVEKVKSVTKVTKNN